MTTEEDGIPSQRHGASGRRNRTRRAPDRGRQVRQRKRTAVVPHPQAEEIRALAMALRHYGASPTTAGRVAIWVVAHPELDFAVKWVGVMRVCRIGPEVARSARAWKCTGEEE